MQDSTTTGLIVKQEMERMDDIIELLETKQACREPIWPEQLKCIKEAFEAHDVNDWNKCRDALICFFDSVKVQKIHRHGSFMTG